MTYREWEARLLGYLESLSGDEKNEVKEYYKEIYNDKKESGMSDSEILRELGDPRLQAARILSESPSGNENDKKTDTVTEKSLQIKKNAKKSRRTSGVSIGEAIGIFFLVTIVLIPLWAVFLSVVISFGSAAISGAAMIICGALGAIASPFTMFFGISFTGFLFLLAVCVALAGVGAILLPVFAILTKYSAIGFARFTKFIFKRRGA